MLTKEEFISEINECRSQYSFVAMARRKLLAAGYTELKENEKWTEIPKKFFVSRNEKCVFAGDIGTLECGVFTGSHIDYPCYKILSDETIYKDGILMVPVTEYRFAKCATWFDRDLGLCGVVDVKEKDGKIRHELIRTKSPVGIMCTVCSDPNTEEQKNREKLIVGFGSEDKGKLRKIIAEEAKCSPEDIVHMDLNLFDMQPPQEKDGYIHAQGLDDLSCSISCLSAFLNAKSPERGSQFALFFNNEEIGSRTPTGAFGNFAKEILKRIGLDPEANRQFFSRSFFISADVTHGSNPNYPEQVPPGSGCTLGEGIGLGWEAAGYMSTNERGIAVINRILKSEENSVKVNPFVILSSQGGGSTIGPGLSTMLGILTVDIGIPVVSMHSIREMSHFNDISSYEKFVKLAFENELKFRVDSK